MPAMPASLRWAVVVLAVQAIALVVLAAVLVYQDIASTQASARGAIGVTAYTVVMAGLLGGLAWALNRRHGWARGPAIVLELLFLPIGYSLAAGGSPALGVPAIVAGLAGAATLLAPATRAALNAR